MLLFKNFKSGPVVPWSVAVMTVILWVVWQCLGGKWRSRSTSDDALGTGLALGNSRKTPHHSETVREDLPSIVTSVTNDSD
jgi:hypothetical protein